MLIKWLGDGRSSGCVFALISGIQYSCNSQPKAGLLRALYLTYLCISDTVGCIKASLLTAPSPLSCKHLTNRGWTQQFSTSRVSGSELQQDITAIFYDFNLSSETLYLFEGALIFPSIHPSIMYTA